MGRSTETSRQILKFIENFTIILMVLIFFSGMSANLSLNKVLDAYGHKNIFTKKLKFINRSSDLTDDYPPFFYKSSTKNETEASPIHKLAVSFLNPTNLSEETTQSLNTKKTFDFLDDDETEYRYGHNGTDDEFLEKMEINLHAITTRNKSLQDYLIYYPLMTLIVATSWCALLICFRSGGYCNDEWVTIGPWRIVIPSVICFLTMLIASIVYIFISNKYVNRLCANLASELLHPERYSCDYLVGKLAPIAPFHSFPTNVQFTIYRTSIKIDAILWFLALCLTSVRWLLAIDFELVKIKLSSYCQDTHTPTHLKDTNSNDNYEDPSTTMVTTLTETEKPSIKIQLHDDRKRSGGNSNEGGGNVNDEESVNKELETKKSLTDSKDDLDDYQSAHSQLTSINDSNYNGNNGNGHEFSSLEPLIHQHRRLSKDDDNDSENTIRTESV